ncbi:Anaerobic benzoate catabolism transcriptional regulator [Kibdelosporangium sp. 4NS15]|uniref:Anaerobic benzoate catabolism transcriptional regulator n=1 Tax=Kibdelosporangium persicum TaxID=2698649 RepID=A0ABX2F483_9PSEU|nr:helix-turn-helix transcriptional regulator [Kibdelosporangium persicum]NRN66003.1 Anaerobic benzoate catabolism transcriptional regulator [Kibdelosporangium persicum]
MAVYQRVLGDEIRRLRKKRGLTRKQLNRRLQSDISLQTLATYELGTRQCSIVRFVEICLALDELPHELIARVHERVFTDSPRGRVRVDLRQVVRDDHPELLPLRRWARDRLGHHPAGHTASAAEVHLDFTALERMAELCGMDTIDLIGLLRRIGGTSNEPPAGSDRADVD